MKWESLQEGYGEVQEMIICDFAVLVNSRINDAPERPQHRMYEQYHPWECWISAFNFPVAVWAWNTAWLGLLVMFAFGNHQKNTVVRNRLSKYYC
jgi:acyl-CoA reductase-like NAD-dependent aldehyde dehydrogenase